MIYKRTLFKTARLTKYSKSGKNAIVIKFPFDTKTLQQVKTIPSRRWHPDEKFWSCPVSVEAIEKLIAFEFKIDEGLIDYFNHSKIDINEVKQINIPGLNGTLFPYQNTGVSFIEQKNGRVLIADEMGLGKTIQALAWLQLHPEKRPVVIVCPAIVKLNWSKEAVKWLSSCKTKILSGTTSYKLNANETDIFIINYDILSNWANELKRIEPQVLITDECHYYKNNKAKRTKAIKSLGKVITHVIALSGTPIVNRPIEIYNACHIIDESSVPSYWEFAQKYCGAKHNGFGWDFTGATNTEELHKKLTNTIMIRRKKMDVLKELPDKIYSYVSLEPDNDKEYFEAESNFIEWIKVKHGEEAADRASGAQALTEIEILKQLAVKGKMKGLIEWIQNFLESDEKLIIFGVHKFFIDALMEAFPNISVKIDGSTALSARQTNVDLFQENKNIRLFIGNIRAAGIGITLTASSSVVIGEFPWTPGELDQAIDRAHRIGQKNSVNVYYPISIGTIEEKIAHLIDSKRKILDSVLDGRKTSNESLLSELINQYKN